jgi:hypothetical protein
MQRLVVIPVLLVSILACACSEPPDPEERLRARIAEAVAAAEARDTKTLLGFVSDRYADDAGRDKRGVGRNLRFQFHRNRTIHIFHKVRRVEITEPGSAHVILLVAVAGAPIEGIEQIGDVRAELLRFDLEMVEEDGDEWRVIRGDWERATPADFF